MTRIKAYVSNPVERVDDPALPYVALEHIESGTGRLLPGVELVGKETDDSVTHQAGDVRFGKLRPYLSKSILAAESGAGSGELLVLRPDPARLDSRYLLYITLSKPFIEWSVATSYGVKMPRTSWSALSSFEVNVPSLEEQRKIVTLLESQLFRLDQLVLELTGMVSLLRERSAAERGRRFAEEPGWPLKRLLARPMAYGVLVPRFVDNGEGVPMLRIMNLTDRGEVVAEEAAHIEAEQSAEYRRTVVGAGDLILSVVGTMGRSAVVEEDAAGSNLNRPLARLQPDAEVPSRLLWHWTKSPQFMDLARLATGWGTAQPTLNLSDLADFRVGLPSDSGEWRPMLNDLEEASHTLYACEDELRHQIVLLSEHRQALISASVAGGVEALGRCA